MPLTSSPSRLQQVLPWPSGCSPTVRFRRQVFATSHPPLLVPATVWQDRLTHPQAWPTCFVRQMYNSPQAILKGMLNAYEEQSLPALVTLYLLLSHVFVWSSSIIRIRIWLQAKAPSWTLWHPLKAPGYIWFHILNYIWMLSVYPSSVTYYMDLSSLQFLSKNVVMSCIFYLFCYLYRLNM